MEVLNRCGSSYARQTCESNPTFAILCVSPFPKRRDGR